MKRSYVICNEDGDYWCSEGRWSPDHTHAARFMSLSAASIALFQLGTRFGHGASPYTITVLVPVKRKKSKEGA